MTDKSARKPTVALAMGDPAGISPELTAKLLALDDVREAARLVVIGDRRVLEDGARIANVTLDVDVVAADAALPETSSRPVFVDLGHLDPKTIERGRLRAPAASIAKENYLSALALAKAGAAHAVAFTPFNKGAMKLAEPSYDDEILFTCRRHRLRRRGARVQRARRPLERARDEPRAALCRARHAVGAGDRQRPRAHPRRHVGRRLHPAAYRGRRPQSTRRRQRQLRPRGDRHPRAGGEGGAGQGHRLRRALSLRHRVRARARRASSTPC